MKASSPVVRLSLAFLVAMGAAGIGGCAPDVGECDMADATQLVYDSNGVPAYAGQAQLQTSCGNGAFCHSARASGADRLGAPEELNFDVAVVVGDGADPAATERLRLGVERLRGRAGDLFGTVEAGTMPPFGEATLVAHAGVPRYSFEDGRRLVQPDTIEGGEIFRNWLACGAPVVERTSPRPAGGPVIGDIVEARSETIEPTFTAIYEAYLGPQCGASCHGPAIPSQLALSQLDLSTRDGALAALVSVAAAGSACSETGATLVVPNDSNGSLLFQKLMPPEGLCGDEMPLGGTTPANVVAALREWIDAGALDN